MEIIARGAEAKSKAQHTERTKVPLAQSSRKNGDVLVEACNKAQKD